MIITVTVDPQRPATIRKKGGHKQIDRFGPQSVDDGMSSKTPSPLSSSVKAPSQSASAPGPGNPIVPILLIAVLSTASIVSALVVTNLGRAAAAEDQRDQRCAVPSGVELASLPPRVRSVLATRQILCADFEAGRITSESYRARLSILDAALERQFERPTRAAEIHWANAVRSHSSQYSAAGWSALHALGMPNVVGLVDDANAWAPLEQNGGIEFIEVGFPSAQPVATVDIVQSFNPGAIQSIELITSNGRRVQVFSGEMGGESLPRFQLNLACTDYDVSAVRVTLDTRTVDGWNEIDAIGLTGCE